MSSVSHFVNIIQDYSNKLMSNDVELELFSNSVDVEFENSYVLANALTNLFNKNQCFRKLASKFNTSNLDILSTITKFNKPTYQEIAKIFDCSEQIASYVTVKTIEKFRKWILHYQKRELLKLCDCCIKTFIKEDLKVYKRRKFTKNLQSVLNN